MEMVPERTEMARQYRWNAESLFPDHKTWSQAADDVAGSLREVAAFKGRLGQSADVLLQALRARDDFIQRLEAVMVYAGMSHSVDTGDETAAAMDARADALYARCRAEIAFFDPEIVAIGGDRIQRWIDEEPGLTAYGQYFENLIRQSSHVRDEEVEEVLSLVGEPFAAVSTTARLLTDLDLDFEPAIDTQGHSFEITQGSYYRLMASADRGLRRSAYENYADAHLAVRNALGANLLASIKQSVFRMRARRFQSTLEASLFEDNIPAEVFHNLLKTFEENLPIWHRYFEVRKKLLGLDKLHVFDIWAPLQEDPPAVPFEQAVDWICEGLSPLGEDYVAAMRDGVLNQRWVDVYPNRGKVSGAFSYGARGTHPFIVMSYSDIVFSLSTLAHELGHSMHSYLTWNHQPQIYSDYSLFIAEVASNFHQAMVRAHLLEVIQEPGLLLAILEEAMSNFHRYFLVMPTLAKLELEIHERIEAGEGVTPGVLNDRMLALSREAYGPAMALDEDRAGIRWAYFRHLYRDYYVFQYATGIAGAHALSARILDGNGEAADAYVTFLKKGSSQYPLDALADAGVDLTSPAPVQATFQVMEALIDRIEDTAAILR